MISVEEALEKILSYFRELETEEKPILESLGQVLAQDIHSTIDVPPADNSAMDGYAVRAADTKGASATSPKVLDVIGEVAAGSLADQPVGPGKAVRIMTGAPVPPGADTVVPFEDTDETASSEEKRAFPFRVGIMKETPEDCNIRRAGEDVPRGARVLEKGTEIRPSHVGVLASLGYRTAPVMRRPRVAVLATGNELADISEPLKSGQLYNSNTYSISAQVIDCGAVPRALGIARDQVSDLTEKVRKGLDTDLLITSGGVSRGDYDMVKDVLVQQGEITFWTVRMKPGKPLAFGVFKTASGRRVPHLGLPGNPVSAMITFELFARPAIFKMMGKKNWSRPIVKGVLEDSLSNRDGRRVYARVYVERRDGKYIARLTGPQGSGILTSMAQANGLAIISEEVTQVRPGDQVPLMLLD
ncbi:MAG: molybdopterin molybdotransferase MoeA [Chloroflexi bacterium]|nr:molybdopterin molybdotransferase MoeA [Chloroflexota bacterium]